MTLLLVGIAVSTFAVTNVDAFVVMTALFATAGDRCVPWMIVGQIAGFVAILVMSGAVTLGLSSVPTSWYGAFALVPLGLGAHGLWTLRRTEDGGGPARLGLGFLGVAAVMIGNGGDNVAVLAPLFRALGLAHSIFVSVVLLVLDGVMCATALRTGHSSVMVRAFDRVGHVVVPVVYSAIGVALLVRAGTLSSFAWHP